jgi:hypothetical protein
VTPTHYITLGFDTDLDDAAKQALRDMIAWLVQLKGWKPAEAMSSAASPATCTSRSSSTATGRSRHGGAAADRVTSQNRGQSPAQLRVAGNRALTRPFYS